jgi:hypothetical protein
VSTCNRKKQSKKKKYHRRTKLEQLSLEKQATKAKVINHLRISEEAKQ